MIKPTQNQTKPDRFLSPHSLKHFFPHRLKACESPKTKPLLSMPKCEIPKCEILWVLEKNLGIWSTSWEISNVLRFGDLLIFPVDIRKLLFEAIISSHCRSKGLKSRCKVEWLWIASENLRFGVFWLGSAWGLQLLKLVI